MVLRIFLIAMLSCHLQMSSSVLFNSDNPSGRQNLQVDRTSGIVDFRQSTTFNARFEEQENQATCGSCLSSVSTDRPFKFFRAMKTWNTARRACATQGGHLAIIRSADDELAVRNILTRENLTEAWLGFHSSFETNEYVSVLDEQLDAFCYSHWRTNQPNVGSSDSCVSYLEYGMQNQSCNRYLPYFCEYPRCSGSEN